MSIVFNKFRHEWQTRKEKDQDLTFSAYIIKYSTLGEIETMLSEKRRQLVARACLCHPYTKNVGVFKCTGQLRRDIEIRHDIQTLNRAYIALSSIHDGTDLLQEEVEQYQVTML